MSDLKIFKYQIPINDRSEVTWPVGGRLLDIQNQGGCLMAWVMVDPSENRMAENWFSIIGTGHPVPVVGRYVKSVQVGQFVWHVFSAESGAKEESPGGLHYAEDAQGSVIFDKGPLPPVPQEPGDVECARLRASLAQAEARVKELEALANVWTAEADKHSLAADEACPPEGSPAVEFAEYDPHKAQGETYYRCASQLRAAIRARASEAEGM